LGYVHAALTHDRPHADTDVAGSGRCNRGSLEGHDMRLVIALVAPVVITLAYPVPTINPPDRPQPRAVESAGQPGVAVAAVDSDVAFEVTEDRERCDHYDPNRQPFFGTTHLHTGLSFDASIRFVDYSSGNDPRGAYRFAKGLQRMQLPDPL